MRGSVSQELSMGCRSVLGRHSQRRGKLREGRQEEERAWPSEDRQREASTGTRGEEAGVEENEESPGPRESGRALNSTERQ